ncbi:hypothetical protein UlMin_004080, partial [Ulmus minor]
APHIIILRYKIIFGAIDIYWKFLNPFPHNLTSTLLFQTQIPSLFVQSTPCSILVSTQPHLYFTCPFSLPNTQPFLLCSPFSFFHLLISFQPRTMAAALVGREFKRSVIDEANQILQRLDDLLCRTSFLGLKNGVPPRSLQRLHAPLVVKESDVVGRDGDKEEIIELLLSDDTRGKNLSVIPIVGMGGIGKTTLAQLVYKDSRVQHHFHLRVWVTVSEEFDVSQITKLIYKEVTSQACETDVLFVLQTKLNEALAGKRFLFVLDDVWNENYGRWDSLKSGFQSGADGNMIIVTTRSKDVVSTMSRGVMHELKLVSDEDCWRIFEKHAFDDSAEAMAKLKTIGLEIVARCKGLPLAVKSIAGLLRSTSNPEEWRQILDSDIWQLQFQENLKNDIVPALWLSYHFLPPALK